MANKYFWRCSQDLETRGSLFLLKRIEMFGSHLGMKDLVRWIQNTTRIVVVFHNRVHLLNQFHLL